LRDTTYNREFKENSKPSLPCRLGCTGTKMFVQKSPRSEMRKEREWTRRGEKEGCDRGRARKEGCERK
jgi:hypothetical protein